MEVAWFIIDTKLLLFDLKLVTLTWIEQSTLIILCVSFTADQYKWLERDLANVDRSITPWLVATWHPPWYSSYKAHYREVECMRVAMEDLLYSYSVDIVFNGHVRF